MGEIWEPWFSQMHKLNYFLDASAEERAKRRYKQLQNKGINGNFAQILAEIQERDFRDRNREVAPLKPAMMLYC